MSKDLRQKAQELAARPYLVQIIRDDSDSEELLYVALNPELEGCLAQGTTVDEAEASLAEFRVDYIEHLLEHGLPVPNPATISSTITGNIHKDAVARVRLDKDAHQVTAYEIEEEAPDYASSETMTVSPS